MTLVVLAAGMGSRYGGLKQMDPMNADGDFIIDYSVYDAVQAGFDEVVFIIKRAMEQDFMATIGARVSKKIKVTLVYQDMDDLPEGYTLPEGRQAVGHHARSARGTGRHQGSLWRNQRGRFLWQGYVYEAGGAPAQNGERRAGQR